MNTQAGGRIMPGGAGVSQPEGQQGDVRRAPLQGRLDRIHRLQRDGLPRLLRIGTTQNRGLEVMLHCAVSSPCRLLAKSQGQILG